MEPSLAAEPVPTVIIEDPIPPYVRKLWGRWKDADKDCQDTRQEVLIAESLDPVVLDERGCRVLLGRWLCPYTGNEYTNPRKLDIDHMVPLREAYYAGGHLWGKEQRSLFYNNLDYPNHLIAVSLSANRSKGSRPPSQWMPLNTDFHCEYLRSWVQVKKAWSLSMECPSECTAVAQLMASACAPSVAVPSAP